MKSLDGTAMFEGQYKDGLRHGAGKMTWLDALACGAPCVEL
jgi:hypothetical protein